MPKHESLTPKAIANKIKAKGLQKLRWYCQMCQKQCRDENGFKCHTMSESHQRQLLLFAENPDKYIDQFSQEFLDSFMELLRRRFGTKRVHANQVYQEYIADRNHLHMNATQWETLTEFVKWLGKEGHCIVDQTEKGWFISYIDRDPETIKRQEALAKKEKMDMDDEERNAKFLEKQIERGKDQFKAPNEIVYTELKKETEDEKVAFNLKASLKKEKPRVSNNPLANAHSSKDILEVPGEKRKIKKEATNAEKKKKSALEEIIEEQEKAKDKVNRKDYWLTEGIVVKIIAKQLGEKYFKKKAIVKEVKDKYLGIVKVIETGDVLKLDQVHLETVIPSEGRKVLVVNGAYRGYDAVLQSVTPQHFCATIKIFSGPLRGRIIDNVRYEDICKLHIQS